MTDPRRMTDRAGLALIVGDVMNDVVVRPHGPMAVGTDTPSEVVHSPGGSGSNQAAWLASLGGRVRFAGRVGAIDAGLHREALEALGVEVRLAVDHERATGSVVALVGPDGERSMFTDRGANLALDSEDLPLDLLEGAALLHVSGYLLFAAPSRAAVSVLWAAAAGAGLARSVDPASTAGLREIGSECFFSSTEGAELLFPNLDEGRLLAGAHEPEEIMSRLTSRYPVVALKLGRAGALVGSSAGELIQVEAPQVEVADSTGSGDAFCAGFLAAWLAGAGLEESSHRAVAASSLSVNQLGARP
jgi:sugar/nucleoside kinase (ribokinase family)